MKKFVSSGLAGLAIIAMLGALTLVSTDANARGKSSGSGTHSHSSGTRAHSSGAHGHTFHRGARIGVVVGVPIIASPWWHYPDPYFGYGPYYPPVVQEQEQPLDYVEQQAPVAAPSAVQAQAPQYWYYCEDSKTYFPYVQTCTAPWQRVVPYAIQ